MGGNGRIFGLRICCDEQSLPDGQRLGIRELVVIDYGLGGNAKAGSDAVHSVIRADGIDCHGKLPFLLRYARDRNNVKINKYLITFIPKFCRSVIYCNK